MDDRKHLRKPDSRWCVARRGDYAPWHVRAWYRWRWQARLHAQRLASQPVPSGWGQHEWTVLSARTLDRDWAEFDKRWERTDGRLG